MFVETWKHKQSLTAIRAILSLLAQAQKLQRYGENTTKMKKTILTCSWKKLFT